MSLADEARRNLRGQGPRCAFERFYAIVGPDIAAEVEAALNDPSVPDPGLRDALVARGYEAVPGISTFGHHRRRSCRCG